MMDKTKRDHGQRMERPGKWGEAWGCSYTEEAGVGETGLVGIKGGEGPEVAVNTRDMGGRKGQEQTVVVPGASQEELKAGEGGDSGSQRSGARSDEDGRTV